MNKLTIKLPLVTLNPYIDAERANKFKGANLKKKHTKTCEMATRKAMRNGLKVETPLLMKFDWYMKYN